MCILRQPHNKIIYNSRLFIRARRPSLLLPYFSKRSLNILFSRNIFIARTSDAACGLSLRTSAGGQRGERATCARGNVHFPCGLRPREYADITRKGVASFMLCTLVHTRRVRATFLAHSLRYSDCVAVTRRNSGNNATCC